MKGDITVSIRENEIVRFIREGGNAPRPIKEVYEAVSSKLQDNVSLQAYYKIVERMVDAGRLIESESESGRVYTIPPHLAIGEPKTLDDIYEMLSFMSPADAIAQSIDALDYFAEKQSSTLSKAAEALKDEDPAELFFRMIEQKVRLAQHDLDIFHDKDIRDTSLELRITSEIFELELLLYRGLSIPVEAVDLLSARNFKVPGTRIGFNPEKLKQALSERIFGKKFIEEVDVSASRGDPRRQRMSVAGSDGSIHAGVLGLSTAKNFMEDLDQDYVTFNNSVAYVEQPKIEKNKIPHPYHCVPMTRAALEDPSNVGMVLAPFMFPELSESAYEHMAKCASDVVQLRVDGAVFEGTARAMGSGQLLPQPIVHIRDGTVTPQEREFKHYKLPDSYGDMVREGIRGCRKILQRIITAGNPPVFAGAVKSTQLKVFSKLLNWYISEGSKKKLGAPIDAGWDQTRAASIADNAAMTFLLAALPNNARNGKYWVTFVIVRRFHSLMEYYAPKGGSEMPEGFPDRGWEKFFEKVHQRDLELYNQYGGEPPYFEGSTIEDDAFVYMCNTADYATFYVGHTGGEPPPMVPRYEFMDSLRNRPIKEIAARVLRNTTLILEAIDETKWSLDAQHNFLTNKKLIKIVPYVTYLAHEHGKNIGRQLQQELKAIVIARLQELKRGKVPGISEAKFLPLPIQKYMERFYNAVKSELKDDPGKFLR